MFPLNIPTTERIRCGYILTVTQLSDRLGRWRRGWLQGTFRLSGIVSWRQSDAPELLIIQFHGVTSLLDLPVGHTSALRDVRKKYLDFRPSNVPAPASRIPGEKPSHPRHTVRGALVLCPSPPQYGNIAPRPPRLLVQRRHPPSSRVRHIIPPIPECYASWFYGTSWLSSVLLTHIIPVRRPGGMLFLRHNTMLGVGFGAPYALDPVLTVSKDELLRCVSS